MVMVEEFIHFKQFPVLQDKSVHVWCVSLDISQQRVNDFLGLLSKDEVKRAERFVVEKPRRNFIVARGMLRILLANYLNILPQDLVFLQNDYGKLYLEQSVVQFNVSHSNNVALFAFALRRSVGVDVEYIKADLEVDEIAQRFFSTQEVRELLDLPPEQRVNAFFNCWVRKEAFIKAIGLGLSCPLQDFAVDITNGAKMKKALHIYNNQYNDKSWSLIALKPAPDYPAAVVVEGDDCDLQLFNLPHTM